MENHSTRIEQALTRALAHGSRVKINFSPMTTDLGRFVNMIRHGHLRVSQETFRRLENVVHAAHWGHAPTSVVVEATELFLPAAFAEQIGHAVLSVEIVN